MRPRNFTKLRRSEMKMKQEYDFSQGKRGAVVPTQPGKTHITLVIDNKVLDWFRNQVSGGGDYVALMNEALRQHIKQQSGENLDHE